MRRASVWRCANSPSSGSQSVTVAVSCALDQTVKTGRRTGSADDPRSVTASGHGTSHVGKGRAGDGFDPGYRPGHRGRGSRPKALPSWLPVAPRPAATRCKRRSAPPAVMRRSCAPTSAGRAMWSTPSRRRSSATARSTTLVNNAAPTDLVGPGCGDRPLGEITDDAWDAIMTVALKQLVWCRATRCRTSPRRRARRS